MGSGGNPDGAAAGTPPDPIGYRPALDGVRGMAITFVVLFHARVAVVAGGGIGVDIFFVLSGFLITTLLLEEWERWHHIWVARFYARRAIRLFPGLLFVLVAVSIYALVGVSSGRRAPILEEVLASGLYVNNLPASIWDHHGILGHTWSLALEEQFYLVWPWVFLLFVPRRHWRALVALLAVFVVVSVSVRFSEPTVHLLIFSLRQRADALALGCIAALLRWNGALPRPSRATRVVAVGAATVILAVVVTDSTAVFLRRGGFNIVALAAAIVILAVVAEPASRGARLLGAAPVVAVGRISYALYLWHFPVFYAVDEHGSSLSGPVRFVAKVGLSGAFATLSLVLVERPTRRWRSRFLAGPRAQAVSTVASQPSASSRE